MFPRRFPTIAGVLVESERQRENTQPYVTSQIIGATISLVRPRVTYSRSLPAVTSGLWNEVIPSSSHGVGAR